MTNKKMWEMEFQLSEFKETITRCWMQVHLVLGVNFC